MQKLRGGRGVPIGLFERFDYQAALNVLKRDAPGGKGDADVAKLIDLERGGITIGAKIALFAAYGKILEFNCRSPAQQNGALDNISKLADVARPQVIAQPAFEWAEFSRR